ncbi:MAG: hypothetical protein ACOYLO_05740 [Ferruginibacter sp.]|jgi:hypothetical protein
MQNSKSANPVNKARVDFTKERFTNEEESLTILAEIICNIITNKMETYEEDHYDNGST